MSWSRTFKLFLEYNLTRFRLMCVLWVACTVDCRGSFCPSMVTGDLMLHIGCLWKYLWLHGWSLIGSEMGDDVVGLRSIV